MWRCYDSPPGDIPDRFFRDAFNIDHGLPLSWLLKDGGADVEYVGVVLCPAAANKAWGSYLEKRMVQFEPRHNDLGVASFFTLCKLSGVMRFRSKARGETFAAFGIRVLDRLVECGFYSAEEREGLGRSVFAPREGAALSAALDPEQPGLMIEIDPIRELWLRLTGLWRTAPKVPPGPTTIIDHRTHQDIQQALQAVTRWLGVEGSPPKPAAVMRELVKISRDSGRQDVRVAAFAMLAAGLEPNADDVAWLVRDADIGYPDEPSFDF